MDEILHALVQDGRLVADHRGETVVPWFSFTKTAIAAAALTLVCDGTLDLDAQQDGESFTLRQLLQHRAGLCDYGELPDYHAAVARGDTPWPAAEMVQRADARRLRYKPGQGWRYSNIGYLFAGRAIERAAGASLSAVLARRVFEPLGLGTVRWAAMKADLAGVAMGQAKDYDPGWVYHGLLVGPLKEAALLLDRLLGGTLLPAHLIVEMARPYPVEGAIVPGRPWRAPNYGLGLMIEAPDGPMGHTGGGAGSSTAVYRSRNAVPKTCAVFVPCDDVGRAENTAWEELKR